MNDHNHNHDTQRQNKESCSLMPQRELEYLLASPEKGRSGVLMTMINGRGRVMNDGEGTVRLLPNTTSNGLFETE